MLFPLRRARAAPSRAPPPPPHAINLGPPLLPPPAGLRGSHVCATRAPTPSPPSCTQSAWTEPLTGRSCPSAARWTSVHRSGRPRGLRPSRPTWPPSPSRPTRPPCLLGPAQSAPSHSVRPVSPESLGRPVGLESLGRPDQAAPLGFRPSPSPPPHALHPAMGHPSRVPAHSLGRTRARPLGRATRPSAHRPPSLGLGPPSSRAGPSVRPHPRQFIGSHQAAQNKVQFKSLLLFFFEGINNSFSFR